MKYELTILVSVSESSERRAIAVVERQLKYGGKDATFVDGEAMTPGTPECGDCGAVLPAGTPDYDLCPTCATAEPEITGWMEG